MSNTLVAKIRVANAAIETMSTKLNLPPSEVRILPDERLRELAEAHLRSLGLKINDELDQHNHESVRRLTDTMNVDYTFFNDLGFSLMPRVKYFPSRHMS